MDFLTNTNDKQDNNFDLDKRISNLSVKIFTDPFFIRPVGSPLQSS